MSRSLPIYIDLLSIYGSFRSIHLLSHRPSTTCLPACLLALPACLACLPCLHALPACLACMPCVRACLSAGRRLLVCLPVYCMYDRMNGWINLSHFQELNALIYPVQTSPILWYLIQHSIFGGGITIFRAKLNLCIVRTTDLKGTGGRKLQCNAVLHRSAVKRSEKNGDRGVLRSKKEN